MPIIDHPTACFRDKGRYGIGIPCQVVQCDFCHTLANTVGDDAGEAANEARKRGFSTIKGAATEPMKWWCGHCKR